MTLRHDAKVCRQKQTSEQIRISQGIFTPKEREAMEDAKGAPLLLEGLE